MIGKGLDCLSPVYIKNPDAVYSEQKFLRVRCGHCIYCKMARTSEWMIRLQCESRYWSNISFVTLTYDEDHVPWNVVKEEYENGTIEESFVRSLCKRDLQLFVKRLRACAEQDLKFREFPCSGRRSRFRYYAVGEYGQSSGSTFRPHYHLILFGYGAQPTEAKVIDKCWGQGFVTVDPFFPETCAYIAGYVQKKLYGDKVSEFYQGRLPEFLCCSQHLGEEWILENKRLFSDDHAYIDVGGYKKALPRYFRKILVDLGILSEWTLNELALRQFQDKILLGKNLMKRGISESDFFKQRYKNAVAKENKKLLRRNKV